MDKNHIKYGNYVIVQRQDYLRLEKVEKKATCRLGNRNIDLNAVVEKPYYSYFHIISNPDYASKKDPQFILEEVKQVETFDDISIDESGFDNRTITDDGQSQTLTKEEIEKLRETTESTNELLETLVQNSKTFSSKTKYCQSKYLKKKEKKYFDYVQIRKPNIRLLTDIWGPKLNLGLRSEHLAYMLTVANIHSDGTYLLHDSGTKGLLTAAVMDRIGANTKGELIYLHPGNQSQRKAVEAMDFPEEQLRRCHEVNLYSVLRCFHQHSNGIETQENKNDLSNSGNENNDTTAGENNKRKAEEQNVNAPDAKKSSWQMENEKACRILQEKKMDSLIVACRSLPDNIISELLPFLKYGGVLVVCSQYVQILIDVYTLLKKGRDIVNIRLVGVTKTNIQVIEDVTHPEINRTCGGYVLSAQKILT